MFEKVLHGDFFLFLWLAGLCWIWTMSDVCWRSSRYIFEVLIDIYDCIFLPYFGLIEPILAPHVPDMVDSTMDGIILIRRGLWEECANLFLLDLRFLFTSSHKRRVFELESVESGTDYWLVACLIEKLSLSIKLERGFFCVGHNYL